MAIDKLVLDPTGADIHGEVARLRAYGPAARVVLPGGVHGWLVTDHAVLRRLMVSSRVSKDPQYWSALNAGEIPQDWVMRPWFEVQNLLTASGDTHERLRGAVGAAFTERRVRALRPRIEAITGEELDRLAWTSDGDIADLRAGFARRLPIRVITELMAVPPSMAGPLCRHADGLLNTSAAPDRVRADYAAMMGLVTEVITYKRSHLADDLTSTLITGPDRAGPRLSEEELRDTLALFITAGHETTTNLLGHAVIASLTHPRQRAEVIAGHISFDQVIEETLRRNPPIAAMPFRFTVEDIDLGDGVQIPRGEAILASIAGANRDPKVFGKQAHQFDARRDSRGHMAFGYGMHRCVGAPLARLEARVALPGLFKRFPHIQLGVDPAELQSLPSFVMDGHRAIPVRLGAPAPPS
ncbi:cytochrome P450 [Nocardia sp. GP40]|uniref:cytochrome P450 family protein n=1 Tax=Nocardia sp. GP40 TaxID=3156268 RepID=UPI003D20ECE0